ncbi:hypothetical protein N9R79_06225 [Vibrio sp.]|nr:hypothetical protein [Vibrio sp.]
MSNNTIDNLLISISRLVTVDSAGVAIAEIDLREGGILIGGGNIGKTSILNAIRLFLLPEENFKDSARKFGFSDKEGKFYTNDESYEHYFPSSTSFLILECDSYLGGPLPHCQILYRGSSDKLDYRRMFTSLRYEQIRHLFWDSNAGEDGIGGRVEGLSVSKVQAFLKREDKRHYKTPIRAAAIKEVIYANQLLDIDAMRYCLFPLSTTSDADVDAFRALVRLLFDMKTGSDTVRLAVANIIESQKKERKDELNFDIDDFIERNEALARKEEQLKSIDNLRPEFKALYDSHQKLKRNKHAEDELMQYAMMVQSRVRKESQALESEEKQLFLLNSNMASADRNRNNIIDDKHKLEGEEAVLLRQHKKLVETVQNTQLLTHQYDESDSIDMIVAANQEHLAGKKSALEMKQNADKRHSQLEKLDKDIKASEALECRYQASINHQEFKLSNQLADSTWMRLAAFNLEIAEANPERKLTPSEQQAIADFFELVEVDDLGYQLFGVKLDAISADNQESDHIKLDKVRRHLVDMRKNADDIRAIDNESRLERIKTIRSLELEINRTQKDIERLLAFSANTQQLQNIEADLEGIKYKAQELENKIEAQKRVLEETRKAHEAQKIKVDKIKCERKELGGYHIQVKAALEANALPTGDFSVLPDHTLALNEENLQSRIDALISKRQAKVEVVEKIQGFVRNQVLENDDKLMGSHIDDDLLDHAFQQLHSRYQGLDEEFDILRKHFVEHKHSVHGIINELKNNREMVLQFEKSINRAFKGVTINDLSKVEAKIKIEAKFNDLVAEIEHLDTHSDQKASDQFIERLKSFSQRFFQNGQAAVLTMEQVVSGIVYRVKKQGQTGWESKSQSTSTVMLINIKLVEILLGKLRNSACTTQFPLVIDEGASVDSSQFDWLLPNMKQAGFRVLSASTNSASSEIIFKFGQHFRLDTMRTATPYHSARTIAFTGMPDSFVAQDSMMDREQLDIFGELNE